MMSEAPKSGSRPRREPTVSPTDYAAFIGQLQLTNIWLEGSRISNEHGPATPEQASLSITSDKASFESEPDGFTAHQGYQVTFTLVDAVIAEIEVGFGLRFSSPQTMTDEIFQVFSEVNLPVNTWPYFREYVATAMGRMGWTPMTLPALKRGVRPSIPTQRAVRRSSRPRKASQPTDS